MHNGLSVDKPRIMGILNTTPDSFSDGGNLFRNGSVSLDDALFKAETMLSEGADIIDVGGESTRPDAKPVSLDEELSRVVPVVEALVQKLGAFVSVDTSTPEVMTATSNVGASMLNDVRALQREGAAQAALATGLPVCVMHMQGQPQTMQNDPCYGDVVAEVYGFLDMRLQQLQQLGFKRESLMVDPGFGFGKTAQHNLLLLQRLEQFQQLQVPLLVGMSRKSIFGQILGREVDQRLAGSLSAAILAAQKGAGIIRVHDVAETRDALLFMQAVNEA